MNAEHNLTIGEHTANMSKWEKVQKHLLGVNTFKSQNCDRNCIQILLLLSMSDSDTSR